MEIAMIKPTKQAYLKHDLFKVVLPQGLTNSAYTAEEIAEAMSKITYTKIAPKGMKFVWCDTDRKDAAMGWFADAGTGVFLDGNCGFGKMSGGWGKEHLTEPEPYQRTYKDEYETETEYLEYLQADRRAKLTERDAARANQNSQYKTCSCQNKEDDE